MLLAASLFLESVIKSPRQVAGRRARRLVRNVSHVLQNTPIDGRYFDASQPTSVSRLFCEAMAMANFVVVEFMYYLGST
jgi:hypothetical protein